MVAFETRTFRILPDGDPRRVIRGKVDLPRGVQPPGGGWPHALLLHGFKGFMDWGFFPDMARRIASRRLAVVRFNVSGSGVGEDLETFDDLEAFSRNTLSRELEDIASVQAWVRGYAGEIDPDKGVWVGHSRGGGLALVHAAEQAGCLGVTTWSAVASFDRFDGIAKARWRRDGFLPIWNSRTGQEMRIGLAALEDLERHAPRFDVRAACRRLGVPVLLVHGTSDETVPVEESETLLECLPPARARLLRIPGGSHTFGIRHPMTESTEAWEKVAQATLEWLDERLA